MDAAKRVWEKLMGENLSLHDAVAKNDLAALEKRASSEKGMDEVDGRGWTALHLAASKGMTAAAITVLRHGANVNASGPVSHTPLHVCALYGTTETAIALMERGADIEAKQTDSRTPLHLCCVRKTTETALALMERGADLDSVDRYLCTPLHYCADRGTTDIAVNLMERGANIEAKNSLAQTALHVAAQKGHSVILRALLKKGARVDAQDQVGDSALHTAVKNKQVDVVTEILSSVSEMAVHLKNYTEQTALHSAVVCDFEPIARLLVEAGAQLDVKDNSGRIPLDYVSSQESAMHVMLSAAMETKASPMMVSEQKEDDKLSVGVNSKTRGVVRTSDGVGEAETGFSWVEATSQDLADQYESLSLIHQSQKCSDDDTSCSSYGEEWTADSPFGSRGRLLKAIEHLKPGCIFFEEYEIDGGGVPGKRHVRYAQQRFGRQEKVVIKFYWEQDRFENALEIHPELSFSDHVCRILQPLGTSKTGGPPCLVFERGLKSLGDWIKTDQSLFDKLWCLHQILTGIKDAHNRGIVHCDIKASNIMFFRESVSWKLLGFDGARKDCGGRMFDFTAAYAAPEVIAELQESGQLSTAQLPMDMWSFGVVAYEVLTGERFYGGDITAQEVWECIQSGRVEENLDKIENALQREALSRCLELDPKERWSVTEALQHVVFHVDSCTTTSQL